MRNYVIINGVNSLTIQGLAIKTMPPITKPIQRTLREEIDGRDGDIVTTLGYGAYDKTIEIGLFGTFDIDEVIAYFNQKGTITFSNEADKVYYFQALEQVDYAELLKFRTANVVLHCQPFKYPTEETPLEEEYEYVTGTGTDITLDNTEETEFNKIELQGNTSQDGTPTPSNPIPIQVVSGDNEISITGKNLFSGWTKGITVSATNGAEASSPTSATTDFIPVDFDTNPNYYLSGLTDTLWNFVAGYNADKQFLHRTGAGGYSRKMLDTSQFIGGTPQGTGDIKYIRITIYEQSSTTGVIDDIDNLPTQLEIGNQGTTFEPFGNKYLISLGVENLLQITNTSQTINGVTFTINEDKTISVNGTATASTQFTLNIAALRITENCYLTGCPQGGTSSTYRLAASNVGSDIGTGIAIPSGINTQVYIAITNGYTCNNLLFKPCIVKGNKGQGYSPYGTTPIEMASIPNTTYKDLFVRDNEGTWYKRQVIGKVVYDGTEANWSSNTSGSSKIFYREIIGKSGATGTNVRVFANYFTYNSGLNWQQLANGEITMQSNSDYIFIRYDEAQIIGNFKTWLGTHNTIVYYILETPTDIEITDETLANQLEAIWNATSYRTQTNITQVNNDLPFMMEVSALKLGSDHLEINNTGNIYSKPTIELEGTGIVDIYLNDVQVFEVDLSEENKITIDTEKMEAYTDTGLANRKVTGDYSTFKLNVGTNDLRFSGALTSATITRYLRWL